MIAVGFVTCDPSREHECAVELRDRLLKAYLGITDPEGRVFRTDKGRPCLNEEGADISVSHSSGAVAVALSLPQDVVGCEELADLVRLDVFDINASRIGIDIEALSDKDAARCKQIAERKFTVGEQTAVASAADPVDEFVRLWTQKESLCKLSGEGLSGLKAADTQNLPNGTCILTRTIEINGEKYYFSLSYTQ